MNSGNNSFSFLVIGNVHEAEENAAVDCNAVDEDQRGADRRLDRIDAHQFCEHGFSTHLT